MRVAEQERVLRPLGRRRRQHRLLDLLLVGEVRPPERRAQREPKDRDQAQLEADLGASSPHSQDDDRLAEHDDHDEAVPFDEVRRRDLEALQARDVGHEPEEDRRRDDERPLELVVHEPGRNEHQRGCDVVGNDAANRLRLRLRRRADVEPAVQLHDGEVAEAERNAAVVERGRDRERHEQESAHAAEQQKPVAEDVERDGVRRQT